MKYATTYHDDGQAFDDLCERLTVAVAGRLWNRLASEGQVVWLAGVSITPEGLTVERKKGGPVRLPFGTFSMSMHEGVLAVESPALGKDGVTMPAGAVNFHPGYRLALALARQAGFAA